VSACNATRKLVTSWFAGPGLTHHPDICGLLNVRMNSTAKVFEMHRSRLFGIACRMLGSRCEAEDLLQDAYLRWHESNPADTRCVVAFLVTITTRLCLDRLRKRKQERTQDIEAAGLSEALAADADAAPSPELQREYSEELSIALAAVFDRLGREERAAFLLHDVFDYDYPELARMLGKAEPACRQIVSRARKRMRETKPRFTAAAESRDRLLRKFLDVIKAGDPRAAWSLIQAEVEYAG
jgi:RNA polymerase sigma-70 factor, ECF subfamily